MTGYCEHPDDDDAETDVELYEVEMPDRTVMRLWLCRRHKP